MLGVVGGVCVRVCMCVCACVYVFYRCLLPPQAWGGHACQSCCHFPQEGSPPTLPVGGHTCFCVVYQLDICHTKEWFQGVCRWEGGCTCVRMGEWVYMCVGWGRSEIGVITLSLSDANVLGSSSNSLTRLCKHFLRN